MASTPVLPVKNIPPTTGPVPSDNVVQSQPPVATPAFRSFFNGIYSSVRSGLAQRRPWSELADSSAFSRPVSFSDAAMRLRKNYAYFRVNYVSVVALVVALSLVTHPLSLLILTGLLAAWIFLYLFRPSDQPVILFGRTFSGVETIGLLVLCSAVVIFLTSVGSLLISALMVGSSLVFAHGVLRDPEDMFLDDQNEVSTGFLSFLGSAATSVTTATPPVVSGRI